MQKLTWYFDKHSVVEENKGIGGPWHKHFPPVFASQGDYQYLQLN